MTSPTESHGLVGQQLMQTVPMGKQGNLSPTDTLTTKDSTPYPMLDGLTNPGPMSYTTMGQENP